ncbi:MAG: PRC-barrel domain-containing protein [Deltaproteobacteria bacterium]|nr:PRC-barrel domain-containing protein [Deltaproteobacteria bacterium]
MYEESLRRRAVIDSAGRLIGEVDGIFMDPEAWKIAALRIKLRREVADELGASRRTFRPATVAVPTEMVQGLGDAVVLRVPASSLLRHAEERAQPPSGPD